jgi:hypothetical protein
MTTATRGLIRYEGASDTSSHGAYGNGWQDQVDMAAACLAAAALTGGMPKVAGTLHERHLARFLADSAAKHRRRAKAKLAAVMVGEMIALAAGCYIGLLS